MYMPLVLIGLIFYYLSSFIYRLLLINSKISWFSFEKIPRRIAMLVLFPFATYIMGEKLTVSVVSWMDWFIVAFLIAVAVIMFMFMYVSLFERKEFATCMEYGKELFKKQKRSV